LEHERGAAQDCPTNALRKTQKGPLLPNYQASIAVGLGDGPLRIPKAPQFSAEFVSVARIALGFC
jgi:hypothetical protein